jgi:hypothetical protein
MADKQTIEYLKEAAKLRNNAKSELERITKELMSQNGISEATARIEAKKENTYKDIVNQLKEVNSQVKELRDAQKEVVGSLMQEEQKLKSLTGLQQSIARIERRKLDLFAKQNSMHKNQKDAYGRISELNKELLELSVEDKISRAEISRQIEHELEQLHEKGERQGGLGKGSRELLALMEEEYSIAARVSNMTEGQQKQLEAQLEVYDGIRKSIRSVLDTAELLTTNLSAGVGFSVIALGQAVGKIGEVNQQLGISLFTTEGIGRNTALMNVFFDDSIGTAQELANQFGSVESASLSAQFNTNLLAKNLGISGKDAAGLVGSFSRLNGGSTAVANDLIVSTRELAKQRGVIPSQVMADLASNTEAFALFGKQGGKNIAEAAVFARQLGVEMSVLTGVADNLLDFESSITKELELSALLGRDVNLNKARELAYTNDLQGATDETLKALGGIEAFNRMDVFQKRAAAELLGVNVAQLQQMVENQGKASIESSFMVKKYDRLNELTTSVTNTLGGPFLTTLGSGLVALGQMGFNVKGMLTSFANLLGLEKLRAVWAKITSIFRKKETGEIIAQEKIKSLARARDARGRFTSAIPTTPPPPIGGPGKVPTAGIGGMSATAMLKGAASVLILSGAMFVAAKAFQQFSDVTWESVAMGISSITGLAAISVVLGKTAPLTLKGAAAIAVLGAGLIPLAFALKLASPAIEAFGNAISSIVVGLGEMISKVVRGIGDFVVNIASIASPQMVLSILSLAGAFTALSASLGMFAMAGIAALPTMGALSLFNRLGLPVISAVTPNSIGDNTSTSNSTNSTNSTDVKTDELIQEIRGLRKDLTTGKVAVYMDGRKVTSAIDRVVDRLGTNYYGIS